MRRPFALALALGACFGAPVSAAVLAPSVDPVATFIAVADSVSRTRGDAGYRAFAKEDFSALRREFEAAERDALLDY